MLIPERMPIGFGRDIMSPFDCKQAQTEVRWNIAEIWPRKNYSLFELFGRLLCVSGIGIFHERHVRENRLNWRFNAARA